MIRRIKLRWYKWLADRAHSRCMAMLDEVDCGVALLRFLNPEFATWDTKFRTRWEKYQNLRDALNSS